MLADMNRMMDLMYGVPKNPLSLLPSEYTYVTTAGTGTYGAVHFCPATLAVNSARAESRSSTERSLVCENLTKQLVAVKICIEPDSIETLQTELEALQAIEAHKKTDEGGACGELFSLLGHGQCLDGISHYIVTSTIPIVCTLESLKSHLLTLPEVFTWLIYSKLTSALAWLKETCEPGIAHGDIHSGNVLIGYSTLQAAPALPGVKIIDFGRAIPHPPPSSSPPALLKYQQTLHSNQMMFLRILGRLLGVDVDNPWRLVRGQSPEDRDWDWCELKMEVQDVLRMGKWDQLDGIDRLRGRWDRVAKQQVERVKGKDVELIWEVVAGVTKEKRDEVRMKIEELLGE